MNVITVGRLVTVTVAVGMLGSCASDTHQDITLADYTDRVQAVCAPAIGAMNGTVEPIIESTLTAMGEEPFDGTELQQFYRTLIEPSDRAGELIDDMLDTLRGLPQPDEHAEDFEQLWDDLDTTMQRARADIANAATSPTAAIELWDIDTSPFTTIDARATALGVPECAVDT
jgi:hypothetical protein